VRAALADELVCKHTLEQVLDDSVLFLSLDQVLYAVHGHVEELVDVLLDHGVERGPVDVFEGKAEALWIEVLLLYLHEAAENSLQLVQHVLLRRLLARILDFEDGLPERGNHE